MSLTLEKNYKILFQGDSITDARRNKLDFTDLGQGYVRLINDYLQEHYSNLHLTCMNRGIYGNRVGDLKFRWRFACLNLDPDILSLLVGVNNTLRRYDFGFSTSEDKFEEHYRYLLDTTLKTFPNIKLVMMSPFLLPVTEEQPLWFEDLNPKITIVKSLAKEYDAIYIPLQEIFNAHVTTDKPHSYWASDGIHPTLEGAKLIADSWIKAVLK